MIKEYQVTLFDCTNKVRPVSCIIKKDGANKDPKIFRQEVINAGVQKICTKRYWNKSDLVRYNYTKVKVREYDKAKIDAENKARYEAIKKERGWT